MKLKFNYLEDGLSIDETRVSVLILAFVITLIFSFYQVITIGDIGDNLLIILGYEIAAVAGVNIADRIINRKNDYNGLP